VFDGLSDGVLKEIVIVEVKTGRSMLSQRERQVREAVESGKVSWRELRLTGVDSTVLPGAPLDERPLEDSAEIALLVPSLGDGPVRQAVLNRWLVAQGAQVVKEQALCELETDKFVLEIPSPASGYLSMKADRTGPIDGPSFAVALQEQLGLRLDSIRAPITVIVVESVERPSEN
jgi:hypothetical protein